MISERHWRVPHPGFSTKAHGPNGMNVTTALPSRRFRGERFQASIPQPSPISSPPQVLKTSARFTDCSRHSSPKFLASTFSHSVYHANESQACFLRGVLDWLEGLALQLPPLLTPAALARREVYPVFPSCWRRLASFRFCCVRRSCEKRGTGAHSEHVPAAFN
jgi:hypothetical protein